MVGQSPMNSGGYALEVAKLILEYVKALVWPVVALYVTLRYRRYLDRLLDRFSSEATEVEAKFLGVSARLFQQISDTQAAEKSTSLASVDGRSAQPAGVRSSSKSSTSLASPATVVALDQVRVLADIFFSKPFKDRQAAAREVQQLHGFFACPTFLRSLARHFRESESRGVSPYASTFARINSPIEVRNSCPSSRMDFETL
jgi:hypothetical protein